MLRQRALVASRIARVVSDELGQAIFDARCVHA